ncbi:YlmC/YmxH family sporulation protein [Heliophilum fasciatum]|uniref:YlmC/YmxH family sporulation protein n=1 Tax=Heliophilum fasciatum TaxID=35700 RepID=A0A4R2RGP1_9FIRM|nr:YlmC/YmxH family sporulation protein [Heliophilum fasciatum]MCW2278865.1 YlmC/YmxH family sporulation protein [Heliophilum fasciatum]TCP62123.1 YlmC/YmxH family sporulation protein [Heliophilum fasciatum]
MIKISELRIRDIVNVTDGRRLGVIKDIDIDPELGKVRAIVLPGVGRFMGLFGRGDDVIVPWDRIKKIGVDVILVELNNYNELSSHQDGSENLPFNR